MMGPPVRKRKRLLPRGSDDSSDPITRQQQQQEQEDNSDIRSRQEQEQEEEEEELMVIKPEPIEEDPLVILSQGRSRTTNNSNTEPLFREESETPVPEPVERRVVDDEGEEMKEELDEDVKPQLRVNCEYSLSFETLVSSRSRELRPISIVQKQIKNLKFLIVH